MGGVNLDGNDSSAAVHYFLEAKVVEQVAHTQGGTARKRTGRIVVPFSAPEFSD